MSTKLYAVATTTEQKSAKQEGHEAMKRHRQTRAAPTNGGRVIGENYHHRGWPPEVTLAFLNAFVIRPEKGEIQRRLYADKAQ